MSFRIGQNVQLPDGPSGSITKISEGKEHGEPVWYLTVRNRLGQDVTRWVPWTERKEANR